jgi:hypothetical protein
VKSPLLVGIVLLLAISAAAVFGPQILPASNARSQADALAQADLAARRLYRVSPQLLQLQLAADPAALQDSEFLAAAAEAAQAKLDELQKASRQRVRNVGADLERSGVPAPDVTLPPLNAQSALRGYQDLIKANEQLLSGAEAAARSASADGRDALGPAQMTAMAASVRAHGALAEAAALRVKQDRLQNRLVALADQYLDARSMAERYRGRDVEPILAQLRTDRADLEALLNVTRADAAALAEAVDARRIELEELGTSMRSVQNQLETLQQQGFKAGDDASFETYRDRFLSRSRELRALEAREQELRYGGKTGAYLAGPDPASAEVVGGETVFGLSELERRLDIAQQRLAILEHGDAALADHIDFVVAFGRQATGQVDQQSQRMTALESDIATLSKQITDTAAVAFEKEDAALQAARAAERGFSQSQQAARGYINDLRQLQNDSDPERKNPRINIVVGDQYLGQYGRAGQASAQLLVAQIHGQRARAIGSLLADVELLSRMQVLNHPQTNLTFDTEPFTEPYNNAQSEALQALDSARSLFDNLRTGLPPATQWVPLGGLAAAQYTTGLLSPDGMATWANQAFESINAAVQNREASPYLKPYVRFRNLFSGAAEPPADETPDPEVEDVSEILGG